MGKKPFTDKQVKSLRKILEENRLHSLLLNLGVDLMLRSSDLLSLKVKDLVLEGKSRTEVQVKQKTTGNKTLNIPLTEHSIKLVEKYLVGRDLEEFVFRGQKSHYTVRPITGVQYSRIVKNWCGMLGVDQEQYSTHSLRKTKSSYIYEKTKNIEVVRRLLGHSSVTSTSQYLGIDDLKSLDICRKMVI